MTGTRLSVFRCAAALLLLASPALAADWKVVPAKSWLGFKGTMAGATFEGRFLHWKADISFDPVDTGHSHAVVTVDMSSAKTGDRQKDEALPQSDWFDAKRFPTATFEVQTFRPKGATFYDAIGTLTIRDVKMAVALPMTIEVSGNMLHASGHLDLVRTDYGVGQGAWTSDQWVALNVVAVFDVAAERHE